MIKYTDEELIKSSGLTKTKPTKTEIFSAFASKCVDGKILNPSTGRCVALNGTLGKIIQERLSLSCPNDKIINYKTGRCVSKTGSIGKKMLSSKSKAVGGVKKPKAEVKKPKAEVKKPHYFPLYEGITIYTKKGCGYCDKAKKYLLDYGYKINREILVTEDNMNDVYRDVDKLSNTYRYFPMIFIDGSFMGGYVDILGLTKPDSEVGKIVIPRAKEKKTSEFVGTATQELASLVYLRTKHKESCVIIPRVKKGKSLKEAQVYVGNVWSSIDVIVPEKTVKVVYEFKDEIAACLADDSIRFIIISLGLVCKGESTDHANIMIYDKTHGELERFEPHGSSVNKSKCYGRSHIIDPLLEDKMRELIPGMKKYYEPESFCPYLGPQRIETQIAKTPGSDKGGGYCAAWSIWYADVRLSNPDVSRGEALAYAKRVTREDPQGIKNYIRSYSQFLKTFSDRLSKSKKPDDMVDKYIKDGFKK